MIELSGKTFDKILRDMLARVPSMYDKREGSLIDTSLRPAAWWIEMLYMALIRIQKNSYMLTADEDAVVDYIAAERGLFRREATFARCEMAFNVDVGLNARFSTVNGTNSVVFLTTKALGLGADGYYHYEATAETPGEPGNLYVGSIQPLDGRYGNALEHASIVEVEIPGEIAESNESLKDRWAASFSEKYFAGNIASYRDAILGIDGVGGVQVWPLWQGGGTVMCSIIDVEYNIASPALIDAVQEIICLPDDAGGRPSQNGYVLAPVGAAVTILPPTALPVNLSFTLTLSMGYTEPAASASVGTGIESAVSEYLLGLRKEWGKRLQSHKVEYPLVMTVAQLTVAISSVIGFANDIGITINGQASDLELAETSTLQELPFLNNITYTII